MKIVQVVADGKPGGGTTVVLGLVEGLVQGGHDVTVITEPDSYASQDSKRIGAEVIEVPFFEKSKFFSISKMLKNELERLQPEVVHLHGNRAVYFGGRLAPDFPKAAFHYTVHGYHFDRKAKWRRAIGVWAEKYSTKHLNSIVFVCEYDRELGRNNGLIPAGARASVIYNGVRTEDLPRANPDAPPVVAYLGRLIDQKDPILIVEIAGELAEAGIKTVIIGGGPMRDEVEAKIVELGIPLEVEITGPLPRPAALERFCRARAMVLPSRWEGFPVAALEAMAMGVPVVASNVCGLPEMIESGKSGWLIDDRTPEAYAGPLIDLCRNDVHHSNVVDAARERVSSLFSWELCLSRHLDLYHKRLEN